MSIAKRLKVILAALTQDWQTFRCPCGHESYICGHSPLLDGLLCEQCESVAFDKWMAEFNARHDQEVA